MPRVTSFPPIARSDARVLILGSMPGEASLAARRYYAHPRNAFWPIMSALCGFAADAPYAARLARLRERGIALWDVLQSCERQGSLDGDIVAATAVPNDFAAFLARHRAIVAVACNGGTALRTFTRVARQLTIARELPIVALPSTSPAHAGRSFATKVAMWRSALGPLLIDA